MQFLDKDIIPKKRIQESIEQSVGSDNRTVKKYIDILKRRNIISFLETRTNQRTSKREHFYQFNQRVIEIELKRLGLKLPIRTKTQTTITKKIDMEI